MTRKIALIFIATVFLTSCQKHGSYQNAKIIPATSWSQNNIIRFKDSLTSIDPEKLHFEINLRHTNLYPYQNIWLYIKTKTNNQTVRTDSIDWRLAEPSGHWLGTGWGSLYNISYRLEDLIVPKTKHRLFTIEIQHGLKDENLKGVENVGIRLYSDAN